jgi:tRNA threonylcarbamoyl adenosine modification protein YeaZ
MTRILYLDTTTSRLLLGLSDHQRMLAEFTAPCESHRYHSAMLIPAIENLLKDAKTNIQDLTALAINWGPGSFTGIRTGITTARTMGQFLKLPIYGFNTFEILTAHEKQNTAVYLDALRLRSYHAVLRFENQKPLYQQEPVLQTLNAENNQAPPSTRLLISPSLASSFPNGNALIIEDTFTPSVMLELIQANGPHFKKTWTDIKPFYLQAPSITVKPTRPKATN